MARRTVNMMGMLGALVATATIGAGCSGAKSPTFRVAHVQMREQTGAGTELLFVIEAANPNAEEVPLYQADYALSLGEGSTLTVRRTPETTLRRYSTQTFVLPVSVPAEQMPQGDRIPYSFRATITYILPGELSEILFDREIRKPKSTFADSGTLDFSDAAAPGSTIGAATEPGTDAGGS